MKKETYIQEKELSNMTKSIPYEILEILGPMMKTHICKIECKDGRHGTRFFCNIPYGWNTFIKVLLTNNHILNKDDILPKQIIKFSINNNRKDYEIEIDNSRKTFTNEECDITIIEIKEKDKLDTNSFFEIDNHIFEKNAFEIYKNKQIYLFHYPKGLKMECSIGLIKNISINNYNIQHLCDSSAGSSGVPIINSLNFKVIGIHKGGAEGAKNYNVGTLLKKPIEMFKEENYKNEKENNNKQENIKENYENKEKANNKIKLNEIIENKANNNLKNKEELNEINKDEIAIQYKIENIVNSKNIRIFGDKFVENNKEICKIILNENEIELCSHLNINANQLNNGIFEIRLKGINKITNMSNMFKSEFNDSIPLSSLSDISKLNTQNATNMSFMFYYCESLSSLPDISNWDTKNVTNMN